MTRSTRPGSDLDDNAPAEGLAAIEAVLDVGVTGYRLRGIQGRLIRKLGESIVRGLYPPGTLLPREGDLMEAHDASRTSVREAIKVLSAKGLVETRQRIGTRVRDRDHWNIFDADVLAWHGLDALDDAILRDLIEMRQLVEPPAARLAAGRASLDDLAAIGAACDGMRAAMSDMEAYAKADVAFHVAVFAASHNQLLKRFAHIVANFMQISFRIQQQALDRVEHRVEDDLAIHIAIFEAIDRGDAAAAEAGMMRTILDGKADLQRARAQMKKRFGGRRPPSSP